MLKSDSLKLMSQNSVELVYLRSYMLSAEGWGNDQGRDIYLKLLNFVESRPGQNIFGISLDGVEKTDASFPRESVIEVARRFRGERGFYLCHVASPDLKDNWEAAAQKRQQPIFLWHDVNYEILGPKPSEGSAEVMKYVLARGAVTASEVGKRFREPVNNVSNKLRQLVAEGFLLRKEQVAATGGIEFVYYPIH